MCYDRASTSSPLNTHYGGNERDGRTVGRRRAEQTKWPLRWLLWPPRRKRRKSYGRCSPSPFIVERREAGWSGIVVSGLFLSCFATTMTILLLSSPSHSPCQRKPNVRPSELSLFISPSAELGMLFLPAKIPLRFSHPCLMRPFAMSHYGGKTRGKCRTLTSCDLVITRPSIKPAVGPRI